MIYAAIMDFDFDGDISQDISVSETLFSDPGILLRKSLVRMTSGWRDQV